MKLGLGLAITRQSSAPAWTPADLSGLVATVDVARSRAAGLLWQNTAKTVPAVADGDPVRVSVCPYTAVESTAPSDAARPLLWDETGGRWSLAFDGVDDRLLLPSATRSQPLSMAGRVVVTAVSPGSNQLLLCWRDNCFVYVPSGGTTLSLFAGAVLAGFSAGVDQWASVVAVADGASSVIRVGSSEAAGDAGTNSQVAAASVGAAPDGTAPTSCRVAGAVFVASSLDLPTRSRLSDYLSTL